MIVGAGPAGTSTWLHLKKYAPELADHTVVIDKAVFPRHKLCGGGVWGWSEDIFRQLDIDINISALSLSDVEFRFRHQTWLFHSEIPFRMVQRADFDCSLVTSAVKRGMVFHENEKFVAVRRQNDSLAVSTNQGDYLVKALVGADGSLSQVRRSMMRPCPSCLAPTIQVSAPADSQYDEEFTQRKMSIDFTPVAEGLQGYAWHFPCLQNGKPFINHGIGDFRLFRGELRADMKKIFRRELKKRHIDDTHTAWSSHPLRWFSPETSVSCPHAILVGDAVGIDPALGGGIHMALSSGKIAAMALIQAFNDRDYSFRHYQQHFLASPLGQEIKEFIVLAHKMYSGEGSPVDHVRAFFTERIMRRKLRSLLKRHVT